LDGKTLLRGAIAGSVHAWDIRKSAGRSFKRWQRVRGSRHANYGAG